MYSWCLSTLWSLYTEPINFIMISDLPSFQSVPHSFLGLLHISWSMLDRRSYITDHQRLTAYRWRPGHCRWDLISGIWSTWRGYEWRWSAVATPPNVPQTICPSNSIVRTWCPSGVAHNPSMLYVKRPTTLSRHILSLCSVYAYVVWLYWTDCIGTRRSPF